MGVGGVGCDVGLGARSALFGRSSLAMLALFCRLPLSYLLKHHEGRRLALGREG